MRQGTEVIGRETRLQALGFRLREKRSEEVWDSRPRLSFERKLDCVYPGKLFGIQNQQTYGRWTPEDACPHVIDHSIRIFPDPVCTSTGTPPPPTLPRTSFRPIEPWTVTG